MQYNINIEYNYYFYFYYHKLNYNILSRNTYHRLEVSHSLIFMLLFIIILSIMLIILTFVTNGE